MEGSDRARGYLRLARAWGCGRARAALAEYRVAGRAAREWGLALGRRLLYSCTRTVFGVLRRGVGSLRHVHVCDRTVVREAPLIEGASE